jgi:hypothetical protein
MIKPRITRTYGPIHFEDLDPHRFEDLIRELIYDYKDWQSIEATGRTGSDEGFDIRAYEKDFQMFQSENINDDVNVEYRPTEGNLWMIQVKREKEIGPEKIRKILQDIDPTDPPYGYILAASVNFSKRSYDVFRETLSQKGVLEFHLWGKAILEDMLHLPKNDRILFTFFGISLTSKRKSKANEIRAGILIKNKLTKIIPNGGILLIRDLNDNLYPFGKEFYKIGRNPPWNDYSVIEHHPIGILIKIKEFFAYVDRDKKEWDFTEKADLINHVIDNDNNDKRNKSFQKITAVKGFYDFLPRSSQGNLEIIGLLKYSDIELVDEKGDSLFNFPHIFVNFINQQIRFHKEIMVLVANQEELQITDEWRKIDVFPSKFSNPKIGKVYKNKEVEFSQPSFQLFMDYKLDTICCDNEKLDFLNPRDIILIDNPYSPTNNRFIQITYKIRTAFKDYLSKVVNPYDFKKSIEAQLGRIPGDNEPLFFYEFKSIYDLELEEMGYKNP